MVEDLHNDTGLATANGVISSEKVETNGECE
jgi:hypothetical protein